MTNRSGGWQKSRRRSVELGASFRMKLSVFQKAAPPGSGDAPISVTVRRVPVR